VALVIRANALRSPVATSPCLRSIGGWGARPGVWNGPSRPARKIEPPVEAVTSVNTGLDTYCAGHPSERASLTRSRSLQAASEPQAKYCGGNA